MITSSRSSFSGLRLNIFLPVHNRSQITTAFVSHLLAMVPKDVVSRLWLLDDGCTDNTVVSVSSVWAPHRVIRLGGNAYWGGALNCIRRLVKRELLGYGTMNYPSKEDSGTRELVMVCNDDIRFCSDAIIAGLSSYHPQHIIVAAHKLAQFNPKTASIADLTIISDMPRYRWDPSAATLARVDSDRHENLASTYALISSPQSWLDAGPIPFTIPHYLSDFWLTYQMHKAGYSLLYPPGFECLVNAKSTNNTSNINPTAYERTPRFQRLLNHYSMQVDSLD